MKTILKSIIQRGFSVWPSASAGCCVPILMYHSIDSSGSAISVSPEAFRRQLDFFAGNGWRTQPLRSLLNCLDGGEPLAAKSFIMTFDDGFENVARSAWPVMRSHGFTGTVFLPAGRMGGKSDWSSNESIDEFPIMTWETARSLLDQGMEFGSHTVSHPFLTCCGDEELRLELEESKRIIEDKLGTEIDSLCYPSGDYDGRVAKAVKRAGYRGAVTIFEGNQHSAATRFEIPRVYGVDYEPLSYYSLSAKPGFRKYVALRKSNVALEAQIQRERQAWRGRAK